LDCYTALQIAETLIRPLPVMAETLVIALHFCCLSREPGHSEVFGNLIHQAVSHLNTTQQANTTSQS